MLINVLLVLGLFRAESTLADCHNPIDPARRVDTMFVRVADVDHDGALDTIRLRVTAARFDRPFVREFSIVSNGQVILSSSIVDNWLDAAFRDNSFGLTCTGYLQCKCTWYSDSILKNVTLSGDRLGRGVFDAAAPSSIYRVAAQHLIEKCGASAAAARVAIGRAVVRLRELNTLVVVEPLTPALAAAPMAWFPEFSCFAPIYID
jgi:hypothetical protein